MRHCRACGAPVSAEKILRTDECPACGGDLHSCRNCRHFNPKVHNQCEEPVAEWVSDKERANYCDYFAFAERVGARDLGGKRSAQEEAREKWKKLFRP